jgi:predicted SAM-dependent methyltransferase
MMLQNRAKDMARAVIKDSPVPLSVFQEVRSEAHLAGVRLTRRISPRARASARALLRMNDVKLHFGCGQRILPGWVNIDGWHFPGVDFVTDLRRRLPFADATCRLIFTEHVFECIDIEFRLPVLRELRRVLKPEGTLRIVVPDCAKFASAYLARDDAWFHTVLGWPGGAEGLNTVFTRHKHRFIDDWESLSATLRKAGFSHLEHSSFNASEIPELRIDHESPSRAPVSLYVEARR